MALDNLSPVGIGRPVWFVLLAMNGACDRALRALSDSDPEFGGL